MSYRRADEQPPEAFRPMTDQAGQRLGHLFEVNPALMTEHVRQQDMPTWDTYRIADSRIEHLAWMHRHWATVTLSGADLLAELVDDQGAPAMSPPHEPTRDTSEARETRS